MKTILLLFLFTFSTSFAQTYTEKYNEYLERYEYRNSNGDLVGYKKWNSYKGQYEYIEIESNNNYYNRKAIELTPVTSSYDFNLINKVLATKQQNYDTNKSSLDDTISYMRNFLTASGLPIESQNKIKAEFNSTYLSPIYAKNYDFSNKSLTKTVVEYLISSFNKLYTEEVSAVNNKITSQLELKNKALNQIAYNSGSYFTNDVIDERFNPNTNKYEFTGGSKAITKVYIDGIKNELSYFRNENGEWKGYRYKYDKQVGDFYQLLDVDSPSILHISIKFDMIVFWEYKIGDTFTKRYIYRNLKKSN